MCLTAKASGEHTSSEASVTTETIEKQSKPTDIDGLYKTPAERRDTPLASGLSTAASLGITPRLSAPIPLDQIIPGETYLMIDQHGRILMPNDTDGSWNYAFFSHYKDNSGWAFGISFDANPNSEATKVTLGPIKVREPAPAKKYLHLNTNATSWNWAFWGTSAWDNYAVLEVQAETVGQPNENRFKLYYRNGSTDMYLCADGGDNSNYAYTGNNTYPVLTLTVHKYFLSWDDLKKLFQATWPNAQIDQNTFKSTDPHYQLVDRSKVEQIYGAAGLNANMYIQKIFDSDDFAFVMKAQASKQAYSDSNAGNTMPTHAYAIGIIVGEQGDGIHAANVFIDIAGNVRILEPQNGVITWGVDWPYKPIFIIF